MGEEKANEDFVLFRIDDGQQDEDKGIQAISSNQPVRVEEESRLCPKRIGEQ